MKPSSGAKIDIGHNDLPWNNSFHNQKTDQDIENWNSFKKSWADTRTLMKDGNGETFFVARGGGSIFFE